MSFPQTRLRRLRSTRALRGLVRETRLTPAEFIYPMFVAHGVDRREPIPAMPGIDHLSIAHAVQEAGDAHARGIPAVLLFGLPAAKDELGSGAYDDEGIVQLATRAIKDAHPELLVITDLCLCEYTSHGHCGVLSTDRIHPSTTTRRSSCSTAPRFAGRAGADIIAPSDMMDGRVGTIRRRSTRRGTPTRRSWPTAQVRLGLLRTVPRGRRLRARVRRPPRLPDGPANGAEALREARLDVEEGADILIVKPALPYLDVVRRIKDETVCRSPPTTSRGEYSMLKAAAQNGWLDERAAVLETLTSIRRAGADMIITYHAKEAARWLSRRASSDDRTTAQAAQPQGGRRDRPRRPRQAAAEPDAGPVPDHRAALRARAEQAEMTEQEVMQRVQRLLDERIIRQVTPIFDTRALGYESMLVAAKVDPDIRGARRNVINAHPGVSHNYLRNHEFNIWFTIATEPDSSSGCRARSTCWRARPAPSRCASCRR